ncbi:MAG: DUF2969 domain-containing protein [Lactobacillus sp.]|nr:DUF2969 domain-containing protein [Lactobacillus sp.]MDN6043568.1 DUF2969 domain-containing protein [Lactobacillus sp.]MDN6052378.1 DUF2969 domain-containing protein [Lactobacillus sp.]
MSKKPENIQVEINELKGRPVPTWVVVIPNYQTIGQIEQIDNRYRAVSTKNKVELFNKTLESSINDLLSYFALHEK